MNVYEMKEELIRKVLDLSDEKAISDLLELTQEALDNLN